MFLTTEAVISDQPEDKKSDHHHGAGMDMGGMM